MKLRAIHRMLWRDLWGMRGQAAAIAMVVAGGVATLVMSLSVYESLRDTRAEFYRDYRFSEVFANLKRAPESLGRRIADLPGVDQVETRVVASVNLEIADFDEPVTGQIVSIPDRGRPLLNDLYLRSGRFPEPGRDNEVVISESFSDAHVLVPGDSLIAVINGKRKSFTIVGVALCPEFIYQLSPGSIIPDFERFGLLWMRREPLATAYDMEGAFNDVVLTLTRDAREEDVLDRLDLVLEPYGGLGAFGRKNQQSHFYLSEEFKQLKRMSTIFPVVFLAVAAFLLNVVMARLIRTQREQIAALKAFGYSNFRVGLHYTELVGVIVFFGVLAGIGVGYWFGQGLGRMYMEFYRFPYLDYRLSGGVALFAGSVSGTAALLGTLFSVRQAAVLPPAEAMRPEPPASYREAVVEKLGLKRWLSQPTRMILRNLERRPVKSFLTTLGIAFSCAIMMLGIFFQDSVDYLVQVQFNWAQRDDISIAFYEPTSRGAVHELASLPGVHHAEVYRSVPVRLRHEHRTYRTAIQGVQGGGDLFRLLDTELHPVSIPENGIVLNHYLGQILGVEEGDTLKVEVLEGSRPVREIPVAALVRQFIGVSGYMEIGALNRMLREGHAISGVYLSVDSSYESLIYDELDDRPRVASTTVQSKSIQSFYDTMAEQVLVFAFFLTILAGSIAFGVVYNSARIAYSERSRELASLRVLGFTRAEISFILLGELAILTLAAIPLGFIIGNVLAIYMIGALQNELFRMPLVIGKSTYAYAAVVVLVSAAISSLIVRRKLDTLDLVEVLKTKE